MRRRTIDGDIVLSDDEREDLLHAVAAIYPTALAANRLLDRFPILPSRLLPFEGTPREDWWHQLFVKFDQGVTTAPYRRLLEYAVEGHREHPVLRPLALRHGIISAPRAVENAETPPEPDARNPASSIPGPELPDTEAPRSGAPGSPVATRTAAGGAWLAWCVGTAVGLYFQSSGADLGPALAVVLAAVGTTAAISVLACGQALSRPSLRSAMLLATIAGGLAGTALVALATVLADVGPAASSALDVTGGLMGAVGASLASGTRRDRNSTPTRRHAASAAASSAFRGTVDHGR